MKRYLDVGETFFLKTVTRSEIFAKIVGTVSEFQWY
jgi:hypothetical protein